MDFDSLKTNGEWKSCDEPEPPAAEIFATTLVMIDTDTLMFHAVSMPTKAVGEFAVTSVVDFIDSLNMSAAYRRRAGD